MANGVLVSGYVTGDKRGAVGLARTLAEEGEGKRDPLEEEESRGIDPGVTASTDATRAMTTAEALYSRPLFDDFGTASPVTDPDDRRRTVIKGAEMARIAGAVYQTVTAVEEAGDAGHAVVARGTTADVVWIVTDSVGYEDDFRDVDVDVDVEGIEEEEGEERMEAGRTRRRERTPILIRTLSIRGFDASDEAVDRERLLNHIVSADPVPLGDKGVLVHGGLLEVARSLYNDVSDHLDLAAPGHRVVLNGHSIGGSLSILLMMLLVEKRGGERSSLRTVSPEERWPGGGTFALGLSLQM